MDRQAAYETARAALERKNVGDADETFDTASVDVVTRWVVTQAIKTEVKRTLPDVGITKAGMLGELLDLAKKGRA